MSPDEIRAWRGRLGLSQREAAKKLGVSTTAVKDWERGDYAPRRTVVLLMQALDAAAK